MILQIIEIGPLTLEVEITSIINDAPDASVRDSADDYRGTREMEWHVVYATERNEHGRVVQCGCLDSWMVELEHEHRRHVNEVLWSRLDAALEAQHGY